MSYLMNYLMFAAFMIAGSCVSFAIMDLFGIKVSSEKLGPQWASYVSIFIWMFWGGIASALAKHYVLS